MKEILKTQFRFSNLTSGDISNIAVWLGLALTAALIESFTYGLVFGWELTLSPVVILIFCSNNKISRNIIFIGIFSMLYPFIAYNITAKSVFLHPLSWLLDFIIVFSFAIPLGFITSIKGDDDKTIKLKIIWGLIGVTFFFIVKWLMHGLSGAIIWLGSIDLYLESLIMNAPYVWLNFGVTFLLYSIIMISLYKSGLLDKININNKW